MTRSFTIARFFCGCAYLNPMDTAIFCPEHRHTPHRGYIHRAGDHKGPGGHILLHAPREAAPHHQSIPGNTPERCPTTPSTPSQGVSDGHHNDWSIPQADLLGLCAACLIDSEDYNETRIATCECGNEQCSYRWVRQPAGSSRLLETPRPRRVGRDHRTEGKGHLQPRRLRGPLPRGQGYLGQREDGPARSSP